MPKIICDVKECTYNYEKKCTRRNIDVEGVTSTHKCQTYCESFVPKSDMTMNYEFASFDGKKDGDSDVYCDAVCCVYEKGQKCYADRINIGNSNVKAKYDNELGQDFDRKEYSKKEAEICKDTQCNTFECKD